MFLPRKKFLLSAISIEKMTLILCGLFLLTGCNLLRKPAEPTVTPPPQPQVVDKELEDFYTKSAILRSRLKEKSRAAETNLRGEKLSAQDITSKDIKLPGPTRAAITREEPPVEKGEKGAGGQDRVAIPKEDARQLKLKPEESVKADEQQASGQDRVMMSPDEAQGVAKKQKDAIKNKPDQTAGLDRVIMPGDEAEKIKGNGEKPIQSKESLAGQDRVVMPAVEADKLEDKGNKSKSTLGKQEATGQDRVISSTPDIPTEKMGTKREGESPEASPRTDSPPIPTQEERIVQKAIMPPPAVMAIGAAQEWDTLIKKINANTIKVSDAKKKFKSIHAELEKGSKGYKETAGTAGNIFPLQGYNAKKIVKQKGWSKAGDYRFFKETDASHAANDLYIVDIDNDGRDDKTEKEVPVLAFVGGVVVASNSADGQEGDFSRHGNYLWIYHPPTKRYLLYANLAEIRVAVGQVVAAGDVIALLGRSGREHVQMKDRTHLHLMAISYKNGLTISNPWPELKRAKEGILPEGFAW